MQKTFPVRIRPYCGEMLKGYALRLARRNGFNTIADIQNVVGSPVRFTAEKSTSNFIAALAGAILISSDELRTYFESDWNIAKDNPRAIVDIRISQLRVCPECMKEEHAHIREEWMFAHMTHCLKHNIRLLETCPLCHMPFDWSADIFDGCTCDKCSFVWNAHMSTTELVPDYLLAETALIGHEKITYLRMLYRGLTYTLRPYDLHHDIYKTVPEKLANLPSMFECAFELICNESYFNQWKSIRNAFFKEQIDQDRIFEAISSKLHPEVKHNHRQSLLPENTPHLEPITHEYPEAVSKFRLRYLKHNSQAWEQVKINDVANILDISNATVVYLLTQKYLKACNYPKIIHRLLFRIRDVVHFLASITEGAIEIEHKHPNHVSLKEISEKAEFFDLTYQYCEGVIIGAMMQSSLPRYLVRGAPYRINNLLFDKEDLFIELETAFINAIPKTFSKVRVRNVCGLNETQYVAFRNVLGKREEGKHTYIPQQTLEKFFEDYILINRWCILRDIKLETVIEQINSESEIISFSYPTLLTQRIFIIQKSTSNLLHLKSIAQVCSD